MATDDRAPTAIDHEVLNFEAKLAFRAALAAIEGITKRHEADTGRYTYRYVDLGDVLEECKRVCQLHRLAITQSPTAFEMAGQPLLCVITTFIHENGGEHEPPPLMMVLPKEAQAYGSALTYAKRYALVSIFAIPTEDDDGQEATTAAQTQPGRRTEAERMIRETIAQMDRPTRDAFAADFKAAFGSTLTDLPAARHGDALTWARAWEPPKPPDEAPEEVPEHADANG